MTRKMNSIEHRRCTRRKPQVGPDVIGGLKAREMALALAMTIQETPETTLELANFIFEDAKKGK